MFGAVLQACCDRQVAFTLKTSTRCLSVCLSVASHFLSHFSPAHISATVAPIHSKFCTHTPLLPKSNLHPFQGPPELQGPPGEPPKQCNDQYRDNFIPYQLRLDYPLGWVILGDVMMTSQSYPIWSLHIMGISIYGHLHYGDSRLDLTDLSSWHHQEWLNHNGDAHIWRCPYMQTPDWIWLTCHHDITKNDWKDYLHI